MFSEKILLISKQWETIRVFSVYIISSAQEAFLLLLKTEILRQLCFGFGRQFDFDFSNTRTFTILLGPKLLPVQLLWIWTMFQSDRRSRRSLLIASCYSSGSQRSHAPQLPIANSVENNAKMGDECRTHYKTPYKCPVCFTQVRSQ